MGDVASLILLLGLVALALVCFLVVGIPVMLLVNKALGAPYEKEAERMKAAVAGSGLSFAEDRMSLRVSAVAPFAFSVRTEWADVRVDAHALYVMRYFLAFGKLRIGQPNLRLTWLKEPGVGGFLGIPILERPVIEGDAVVVKTELRLSAMQLRLRSRDPARLLWAIESMR